MATKTPPAVTIPEWAHHHDQMASLGRHRWAVSRLIELSREFPVMDIPMAHLNLYHDYKSLTLRQFIMHMDAIMAADLSKPIILDEDGEIMDGRHRIMKALYLRKQIIKAVRFEINPRPCEITDD